MLYCSFHKRFERVLRVPLPYLDLPNGHSYVVYRMFLSSEVHIRSHKPSSEGSSPCGYAPYRHCMRAGPWLGFQLPFFSPYTLIKLTLLVCVLISVLLKLPSWPLALIPLSCQWTHPKHGIKILGNSTMESLCWHLCAVIRHQTDLWPREWGWWDPIREKTHKYAACLTASENEFDWQQMKEESSRKCKFTRWT